MIRVLVTYVTRARDFRYEPADRIATPNGVATAVGRVTQK